MAVGVMDSEILVQVKASIPTQAVSQITHRERCTSISVPCDLVGSIARLLLVHGCAFKPYLHTERTHTCQIGAPKLACIDAHMPKL